MRSKDEIKGHKKQMIKNVLDFTYEMGLDKEIKDFNYKNKYHLIQILKKYRSAVELDKDEKQFINQMIANKKHIPTIIYEKDKPELIFPTEKEPIRSIIKEKIVSFVKEKEHVEEKPQVKQKELKFNSERKCIDDLSMEELFEEAFSRLETTKKYMKIVTENLKYEN